jgi:hypothetical protein
MELIKVSNSPRPSRKLRQSTLDSTATPVMAINEHASSNPDGQRRSRQAAIAGKKTQ